MDFQKLCANFYVYPGAVNVGILAAGSHALLIDCCDRLGMGKLAEMGIESVDLILCTQHRRPNTAGVYQFLKSGARLIAPADELHLFDRTDAYWNDWRNRWHIYHHQPQQVLAEPVTPAPMGAREGDAIEWQGNLIHVLSTPGATAGSISFWLEIEGKRFCFCGDAICGDGKIPDIYSLQKGNETIRDYHGFLGNLPKLKASLHKLAALKADQLIPSHGMTIHQPGAAIDLTLRRLDQIWGNYTAVSSLNHYFPDIFNRANSTRERMTAARTLDPPPFIRRVAYTSFAIISASGAAFLIDCGHDSVLAQLRNWQQSREITSVEACWVTHYHDDHVDSLQHLANEFNCPVIADRHLAEIIECPARFFLPCISPNGAPVSKRTTDGDTWQWHEFQFTAFHLPGQTLYHGGLLVEGHGIKVFFAGDSGAPTGIDDYCCGNRNFLGKDKGFRRCIDIWRELKPDFVFNQHQEKAFSFTGKDLDYMDQMLAERERLLSNLLPWDHPNFGTDEWWVRAYPYQQEATAGSLIVIDIQFTNHGDQSIEANAEPVLPENWYWDRERSVAKISCPANTSGVCDPGDDNPDKFAKIWIRIPDSAAARRFVIPFRVNWGKRYLGQFRQALVDIR
ncbi:MBL fold metallo-hydrolase [candidate division KSB1 bacterium]|nr:MBL fold metallo-hydrolase [candidate division KSB1 bacterium]